MEDQDSLGAIGGVEQAAPGEAEASLAPKVSEDVELPRFFELTAETALPITGSAPTRLLVVAGQEKSGKTTLVASIYERFLRQCSFAGYCFAGSETLRGFEQRCHLARLASGLLRPETERTRLSEQPALLHLRVRPSDLGGSPRDLLFTDIFGEVFREAKDSTESCKKLGVLRRADRVLVLIDGSSLADQGTRFGTFSAGRDFLRRSADARMLGPSSLVDVVVTKWDVIEALTGMERAQSEEYVDSVERLLRENFNGVFAAMRFGRVAARPNPPSALPPAYGLDGLFREWVEESALYMSKSERLELPALGREIDRYAKRRKIEVGA